MVVSLPEDDCLWLSRAGLAEFLYCHFASRVSPSSGVVNFKLRRKRNPLQRTLNHEGKQKQRAGHN
jgi:hypothetical protein